MDFICTLNRDKIQNLIDEVVLKHFENENFMVKNELSKLAIVLLLNRKSEIKFFLDKLRKTPLHMGIEGGGEGVRIDKKIFICSSAMGRREL